MNTIPRGDREIATNIDICHWVIDTTRQALGLKEGQSLVEEAGKLKAELESVTRSKDEVARWWNNARAVIKDTREKLGIDSGQSIVIAAAGLVDELKAVRTANKRVSENYGRLCDWWKEVAEIMGETPSSVTDNELLEGIKKLAANASSARTVKEHTYNDVAKLLNADGNVYSAVWALHELAKAVKKKAPVYVPLHIGVERECEGRNHTYADRRRNNEATWVSVEHLNELAEHGAGGASDLPRYLCDRCHDKL